MTRSVVLVGMPGSGKTTVGRALARALGRRWVDLDAQLVKRWGSISRQFRDDGEAVFRSRESSLLARVLAGPPVVLSAGGGVVLAPENRRRLLHQATVYLQVAPSVLARRLAGAGQAARPLLADRDLLPWLRTLSRKRARFYRACAVLTVRAGQGSPEQVAERVKRRLRELGLP